MTNPTLIAQDTPWDGFTLDSIVEALLKPFGLTNDATTGRTLASTAEDADARRYIKQAIDDLHARFPNTWSTRLYTTTWTAGDHSILLPANCEGIFAVTLGGRPLDPLSRDDYLRILKTDAQGGGVDLGTAARPAGYRVTGFADNDPLTTSGATDYRLVLRIYPTPSAADTLVVEYAACAPQFANAGDDVPLARPLQRWVLYRALEMWSSDVNNGASLASAERERAKVEETLHSWFDSYQDRPSRATTRYPRVTRSSRRK